ncbi:hypothetical protein STCU_04662 [Strigomonas culicis]|uniref:Uncharacterized protein n=1 Tax=Strigomonas culicis TaxID=28005 RepID=S9W003_9TRYP|nr:hypothetical protein STCU_04662 [Strigomonas culicis]|eukprot:EPY29225.1 hypothetical protein STCU_04662 [Strigomonas culicis]
MSTTASASQSVVPVLRPSSKGAVAAQRLTRAGASPSPVAVDKGDLKSAPSAPDAKGQLETIHDELEDLRLRRQQLEERRVRLLAASIPPSRPAGQVEGCASCHVSAISHAKKESHGSAHPTVNESRRTNTSVSRTSSVARRHPLGSAGLSHLKVNEASIVSEKIRREQLHHDPYFQLKEAMKKATQEDTMCAIGSFLLEDSSKVYTFGRERRFRPLVGEKGNYYLGTDMEIEQSMNHRPTRSRSANVTPTVYSGTPGPGAYTPRYGKLSKPSILTLYQ